MAHIKCVYLGYPISMNLHVRRISSYHAGLNPWFTLTHSTLQKNKMRFIMRVVGDTKFVSKVKGEPMAKRIVFSND